MAKRGEYIPIEERTVEVGAPLLVREVRSYVACHASDGSVLAVGAHLFQTPPLTAFTTDLEETWLYYAPTTKMDVYSAAVDHPGFEFAGIEQLSGEPFYMKKPKR